MSHVRRWWALGIALGLALLAAQIGAFFFAGTRRVQGYLTAHLERAFGRPVEVKRFNLLLLPVPRFDAESVTIGEDPAFGNEYFLRAERLSANLSWTGFLHGRFEFGTLALSRPSLILVRNQEDRWNIERWLPPARNSLPDTSRPNTGSEPANPANRLHKIDFEDGRVNFKIISDKLAFAFTDVSGSVEQVSPGRWQLQISAQPWRSGVTLQSTGNVFVQGDLAGTSARLQPAEIHVHWDEVSLADLFRLIHGQDYGLRGAFALDAVAKSGAPADETSGIRAVLTPGDWGFSIQARASHIHRWDLTERSDNPGLNFNLLGRWNIAAGDVRADRVTIETAKSNLRGNAQFTNVGPRSLNVRIDSSGIQAADLLAWYRAFRPGVNDKVSVAGFLTGGITLSGWPLRVDSAAFSSAGGELLTPALGAPVRAGAVRGSLTGGKLTVEPVRLAYTPAATPERSSAIRSALAGKKRVGPAIRSALDIGLVHDFNRHAGAMSVEGHVERVEDVLRVASDFGRTINHGWELSGSGTASLHFDWDRVEAPQGRWNGRLDVTQGRLQAAGLNQPLELRKVRLEWKDALRTAEIGRIEGFGALWSGRISQAGLPDADGNTRWNCQLHADHLDAAELDRWVGPRARPGWLQRLTASLLGGSTPTTPAASELLRRINASGEIRVDEFSMERVKLNNLRANGNLRDLHLQIASAEAQWSGGKIRGKGSAIFLPKPAYDLIAEIDRINLTQLPVPPRLADRFAGAASGTFHLTTAGVGRDELLQGLTGRGDMRFRNVEFLGWDVNASVADGKPQTGASHWSEGEATFSVRDRSVVLAGLKLQDGPELTFVKGTLSFGQDAELTIETSSGGAPANSHSSDTGNVLRISGPLEVPHVSIEAVVARQPAD